MYISVFLFLLFTTTQAFPFHELFESQLEARIKTELDAYIETKEVGYFLKTLAEELDLKDIFSSHEIPQMRRKEPRISLFCATCHTAINVILAANVTQDIFDLGITLCIDLGIGNRVYCEGVITISEPAITWLFQNGENENGNDICGILFVSEGCTSNDPKREWSVTLPAVPKPPVYEPPFPQNPPSKLKVLHLADTHFDPNYLPGSNAVCPELHFCCQAESGTVQNPEDAAGYWGDYRYCDIPLWTLEAMYKSIAETHPDIDFIVWTGDIVPHLYWGTSRPFNLDAINEMAQLVRTYFPGIPVFPAVGNHEANPTDLFAQPYIDDPEFKMSWLYVDLANLWSFWLPPDTVQDILYSAYYSTQVRTGLRIVSLNTNWCYGNNWFLIHDSTDIAEELDFLANELQSAEDVGDRVYIIGHHPPGNKLCELTWSREFNRIVSRYEDTVTGMFYGHTHYDHYELFFDPDNATRVYDIAYIGQSQTPFANINPGYKVYTIEGDFNGSRFRVLDHDNYILDLDEANLSNVTNFFRQYRASEAYGLPDLSPQSWLDLVYQMKQDDVLFDTFYTHYVKGGTPALARGCSGECKDQMLCRLLISDNSDNTQCEAAGLG